MGAVSEKPCRFTARPFAILKRTVDVADVTDGNAGGEGKLLELPSAIRGGQQHAEHQRRASLEEGLVFPAGRWRRIGRCDFDVYRSEGKACIAFEIQVGNTPLRAEISCSRGEERSDQDRGRGRLAMAGGRLQLQDGFASVTWLTIGFHFYDQRVLNPVEDHPNFEIEAFSLIHLSVS